MSSSLACKSLHACASPKKAAILQRFFKTGPGQYGEGDIFIGVKVPEIRHIARQFNNMPISNIVDLLHSKVHEERLLALVMMTHQFDRGNASEQKSIFNLYIHNTAHINNWDLVDISAPRIPGKWLLHQNRGLLNKFAASAMLWERRIAIVSTLAFIREKQLDGTFHIAKKLLYDKEDLMHKATGWMLREAGKQDINALKEFLDKHLSAMPRTMLRYAIEKFPEKERREYLTRIFQ